MFSKTIFCFKTKKYFNQNFQKGPLSILTIFNTFYCILALISSNFSLFIFDFKTRRAS